MTNLLDLVARYLASKMGLVAGTNVFYNEMPDDPAKCVLVQEIQNPGVKVLPQIDAEIHWLRFTARDTTHPLAQALSEQCWRWLLTEIANFDLDKREDSTGFITLDLYCTVQVTLYGNPVWDKNDQKGRKYYNFYATILSKR